MSRDEKVALWLTRIAGVLTIVCGTSLSWMIVVTYNPLMGWIAFFTFLVIGIWLATVVK